MIGARATVPTAGTAPVPAEWLLHPASLAAIALLAANDHLFKAAWPGLVTGKLSDFAGLAFFPLVLLGVFEVAHGAVGRWKGHRLRPLVACLVLTAIAFALVKTTEPAAHALGWLLGAAQWLPAAFVQILVGGSVPDVLPAPVAVDPTDLVALPALLVPLAVGMRTMRPPNQTSRRRVEPASVNRSRHRAV